MSVDMNEALLKSVEVLPPLPDTVSKLRKYIDEAGLNIEIEKIAEIISADPLLTTKLLQLANSPFYGFTSEVKTISQVITLLGIGNIKNIVFADSIKSNFKIDVSPYGLDTQNFLSSCNEETTFIADWLGKEDKRLSHLLVPCVMLLRLGIIVFSNFLIQNKKDKEFLAKLQEREFHGVNELENEFLGVDHISFLGFLLHRWDFDEHLIEGICFAHTPHAASDEVKKISYALAIVNRIFSPYDGCSSFSIQAAIALIHEAKNSGVHFDLDNFISKLPEKAKKALAQKE